MAWGDDDPIVQSAPPPKQDSGWGNDDLVVHDAQAAQQPSFLQQAWRDVQQLGVGAVGGLESALGTSMAMSNPLELARRIHEAGGKDAVTKTVNEMNQAVQGAAQNVSPYLNAANFPARNWQERWSQDIGAMAPFVALGEPQAAGSSWASNTLRQIATTGGAGTGQFLAGEALPDNTDPALRNIVELLGGAAGGFATHMAITPRAEAPTSAPAQTVSTEAAPPEQAPPIGAQVGHTLDDGTVVPVTVKGYWNDPQTNTHETVLEHADGRVEPVPTDKFLQGLTEPPAPPGALTPVQHAPGPEEGAPLTEAESMALMGGRKYESAKQAQIALRRRAPLGAEAITNLDQANEMERILNDPERASKLNEDTRAAMRAAVQGIRQSYGVGRTPESPQFVQAREQRFGPERLVSGPLGESVVQRPNLYQGQYQRAPERPQTAIEDVKMARGKPPVPKDTFFNAIKGAGGVRLLDESGNVLSPEAADITRMFSDTLPQAVRGRLANIIDPYRRLQRTAEALTKSGPYKSLFNSEGMPADQMREHLSQEGNNWFIDQPTKGADMSEFMGVLNRIAHGETPIHPDSMENLATEYYHDVQRQMDEAGITAKDSHEMAANKLQAWRDHMAQEYGTQEYEPGADYGEDLTGTLEAKPEQLNIPGTEASPEQELARRQFGKKGELVTPKKPQKPANEGLFEEKPAAPQKGLFENIPEQFGRFETTGEGIRADLGDEISKFLDVTNPTGPRDLLAQMGDYLTARGKHTGHEAMTIYDVPNDSLSGVTNGHPRSVDMPMPLVNEAIDPSAHFVVQHNHPLPNSLSNADIRMLALPGIRHIVAHDVNGDFYVASLTPRARDAIVNELNMTPSWQARQNVITNYQNALGNRYMSLWDELRERYLNQISKGKVFGPSKKDVELLKGTWAHIVNNILAHEGAIDYTTSRQVKPEQLEAIKNVLAGTPYEASLSGLDQPPRQFLQEGLDHILGPNDEAAAVTGNESGYPTRAQRDSEAQALRTSVETQPEDISDEAGREKVVGPGVAHGAQQESLSEGLARVRPDQGRYINKDANAKLKQLTGGRKVLNPIEGLYVFPRTLASLHDRFGEYYDAFLNKVFEGNARVAQAKAALPTFSQLSPESQAKIFAVAEYNRMNHTKIPDDGRPINAFNDKFDNLRGMKKNQIVRLTPEETRGYHELQNMFSQFWTGMQEGWARRLGWSGPWSDDPAVNRVNVQEALAQARDAGTRKSLERTLVGLDAFEAKRRETYIPFSRYGDYEVRVTKQAAPGEDDLGGFGKTVWYDMAPRGLTDMFDKTNYRNEHTGPDDPAPKFAQAMVDEAKKRFTGSEYTLTHGWRTTPKSIDDLDLSSVDSMFNELERGTLRDLVARGMTKEQARAEYDRTYRQVQDTMMDRIVENMRSSLKKRSYDVPGYTGDFSRAVGSYIYTAAHHIADLIHRDEIEDKFQRVQSLPDSEKGVKNYAQWHKGYMEGYDDSLGSKIVRGLQKLGFAYTMAGNPSTMAMFELHTPQMTVPRASMGVGYGKIAKGLSSAWVEANSLARFDPKKGAYIDQSKISGPPDFKAALKRARDDGLLGRDLGAELDARPQEAREPIGERAEPTPVQRAGEMGRVADKWASSTIGVIDQANRTALFKAVYLLKPQDILKMDQFWSDPVHGSHLWRAQADASGAARLIQDYKQALQSGNPTLIAQATKGMKAVNEQMARFMTKEAGGDYGRLNTPRFASNPLGQAAIFLHGFTTRYLSSTMRMLWRHGPEGRAAVAKLLPFALAVVGVEGLPFSQDAENLYDWITKKLTGGDPMTSYRLRGLLANGLGLGKVGAEAVMRGPLSELLGIDLTGRLGLGDFISRELGATSTTGMAAVDVLASHPAAAAKRASSGQGFWPTFFELMPNDIRNFYRAYDARQRGVYSAGGHRPLLPPVHGIHDTLVQALGFRPLAQERAYENLDWRMRQKANSRARRGAYTPVNPIPAPYQ